MILNPGKVEIAKRGKYISEKARIKTYRNARLYLVVEGKKYIIYENKTISVRSVIGKKDKKQLLNLFMKIRKDNRVSIGSTTIAGVRGAEQGKKAQFGVIWDEGPNIKSSLNSNLVFSRGVEFFNIGEYRNAIKVFCSYIENWKLAKRKTEAFYYIALSHIELFEYQDASGAIYAAEKTATSIDMKASLHYYKAVIAFFNNGDRGLTSANILEEFFRKYPSGVSYYWEAKCLYFLCLLKDGQNQKAKLVKNDVLLNCPNKDIREKIQAYEK